MRLSLVLSLLICCARLSFAEILPTTGTFEGIYHEDRWGEGSLRFFRFRDADLRKQLASHEGQHVRVEILRGSRFSTSDPVTAHEIGKVERLDSPILQVKVRCKPKRPKPSAPFVVWVELWNNGDRPVTIMPNYQFVQLVVTQVGVTDEPYRIVRKKLDKNFRFGGGSFGGGVFRAYSQSTGLRFGRQEASPPNYDNRLATPSHYVIPPGDFVPFAKHFRRGFSSGEYEIRASAPADGRWQEDARRANHAWASLDVDEHDPEEPLHREVLRVVAKSLDKVGDGHRLRIHVAPQRDERVRIQMSPTGRWLADLKAYDAEARPVVLKLERQLRLKGVYEWNEFWQFVEVPQEGLVLERKFYSKEVFEGADQARDVERLSLELLTDRGAQKIELSREESQAE